MREGALAILLDSIGKAKPHGTRCILWHSSTLEQALEDDDALPRDALVQRDAQRERLVREGYEVRAVETLVTDRPAGGCPVTTSDVQRLATAAAEATACGSCDHVKFLSDFSRLLYLHEHGGLHVDVDIGLGDMDLGATYHHRDPEGRVPLLGALARNSSDEDVMARTRYLERARQEGEVDMDRYMEALAFLVDRSMRGVLNGLIATRPGTAHLRRALQHHVDRGALVGGMGDVQKILLTGVPEPTGEMLARAAPYTVPPYLLRLDHVTGESDLGAGTLCGR
jgi:hypothetical protein